MRALFVTFPIIIDYPAPPSFSIFMYAMLNGSWLLHQQQRRERAFLYEKEKKMELLDAEAAEERGRYQQRVSISTGALLTR